MFLNSLKLMVLFFEVNEILVNNLVDCVFFPQYTVMQVNAAISFPIEIPDRKAYLNVGYQFNYGTPFSLSNFFKPPYLQNYLSGRQFGDGEIIEDVSNATVKNKRDIGLSLAEIDITAGEFYNTLTEYLISTGNHETCLEKSVCQMARHPFHNENVNEDNLLADMLHFVLTPSKHQGFSNDEIQQQNIFEQAEHFGLNGENCDEIYWECEKSILDFVTILVDD